MALWSYRTFGRLSTGVTPFMLVYDVKVVLPVEIELPSACRATTTQLDPLHTDYAIKCITTLERLDEYKHDTSKRLQCYREKIAHYYNKCSSPQSFVSKTLVLCNTHKVEVDLPQPKFTPPWEGSFVIYENVGNGYYDLKTINSDHVFCVNKLLKLMVVIFNQASRTCFSIYLDHYKIIFLVIFEQLY